MKAKRKPYTPGSLMDPALAAAIKAAREAKGLTQKQLAALVGVSTATASLWEEGRRGISTFHALMVSRVLGVEITMESPLSASQQKKLANAPTVNG